MAAHSVTVTMDKIQESQSGSIAELSVDLATQSPALDKIQKSKSCPIAQLPVELATQSPALDKVQESKSCPIAELPVELVRMVLSHLPDAETLRVAVLSCPLFYDCFVPAEASIATAVMLNQFDDEILPEAVAAAESSSLYVYDYDTNPESREAFQNFVTLYLRQRQTVLPRLWSLKEVLRLGRLQSCVDDFTKRFAQSCLSLDPLSQSASTVTKQEEFRIKRALYWFETYCNLFRGTLIFLDSSICKQQRELFFDNFSPWELEQLGCVHDFLVRAITPAYHEVVMHDILWAVGSTGVWYGDEVRWGDTQYILSFGLEDLNGIVRAESYDEYQRIICSGAVPSPTLPPFEFLAHELEQADEFVIRGPYTPEDKLLYVEERKPLFSDPDSGPADIWRWAYQEGGFRRSWVYGYDQEEIRKWGLVMWDRARLDAINIFEESWDAFWIRTSGEVDQERVDLEDTKKSDEFEASREERQKVFFDRGGTGRWDWGDETKVRWGEFQHTERDCDFSKRWCDCIEIQGFDVRFRKWRKKPEPKGTVTHKYG